MVGKTAVRATASASVGLTSDLLAPCADTTVRRTSIGSVAGAVEMSAPRAALFRARADAICLRSESRSALSVRAPCHRRDPPASYVTVGALSPIADPPLE